MHKLRPGKPGFVDRAGRHFAQPDQILRGKLVAGPREGLRRDRVEAFKFFGIQHGMVVVTTHGETTIGSDSPDHRIGVSSVTDGVAQVDEPVPALNRVEARIESFQIGVDIAENQQSHFSLAELAMSPSARSLYRLPKALGLTLRATYRLFVIDLNSMSDSAIVRSARNGEFQA